MKLIMSTQRPSCDAIGPNVRAQCLVNYVCFQRDDKNSKISGVEGAEDLINTGDAIFQTKKEKIYIKGAFIDRLDIIRACKALEQAHVGLH